MPQLQLPVFPEGTRRSINQHLGFVRQEKTITYIYGSLPIFAHNVVDRRAFRKFTSQLYVNCPATQAETYRAFGVSKISMKRSVKLCREKGMAVLTCFINYLERLQKKYKLAGGQGFEPR